MELPGKTELGVALRQMESRGSERLGVRLVM